jgi:hypothetical protein
MLRLGEGFRECGESLSHPENRTNSCPSSSSMLRKTFILCLSYLKNKNEHEQLELGYFSETKWNPHPEVVSPSVWVFLQQRNERERFLEQKSNEILRAKSMRGSEWVKWWMRAQHPPLDLYLKSLGTKHPRRLQAQRLVAVGGSGAQEPLPLVQPTPGFGRPLRGSPRWQLGPTTPQRSLAFML